MKILKIQLLAAAITLASIDLSLAQSVTGGAKLEPTTTSAAARTEFQSALWQLQHAYPARAIAHLERALALDPQFGLAQIFHGGLKPGLAPAERQAELARGLGAMSGAPAGEMTVALAWREQWSGRAPNSVPLMAAAASLLPGDGQVAWWHYQRQAPGMEPAQRFEALRAAIKRYPDFPVSYRTLGYLLFRTGDRPGGLSMMREYVRIDPNHPNTHASLAELYHFAGQRDDAAREFGRAMEIDSTWSGRAYMADSRLVAGDTRSARRLWEEAIARSLSPVDSVDHRHTLALVSYLEGDAAGALRQLGDLARQAESRRFTASATMIHQRMAVLEAVGGNGAAAAEHLTKAGALSGENTAAQHAHTTLVYAVLKQLDRARSSAANYSAVTSWPANLFRHTLEGFIALQGGDAAAAVTHLKQSEPIDVLSRQLLGEAIQQSNAAEAQVLRQEVLRSATMLYGSHLMDFYSVLAKSRARRTT